MLAHLAQLETFSYPTEDEEKVLQAIRTFTSLEPEKRRAETNFGGKIAVFRVRTDKEKEILEIAGKVAPLGLDLESELSDKGRLSLMMDKQEAFHGKVARGKGIKVSFRLAGFPPSRENLLESARKLFKRE